jgi:hypothetical protein
LSLVLNNNFLKLIFLSFNNKEKKYLLIRT